MASQPTKPLACSWGDGGKKVPTMKSSWEKMRRKSRIFCTLVTHSIPTMAKARMPTRLALPIRRTSWTLKKMTKVEKHVHT